jgi:hypothetical protein
MNTRTSETDSPPAQIVESEHAGRTFASTVLEIVTIFDEEIAREAGENLCNGVLTQLGPRYAMRLLPWKLSVTEFPILTYIVARKAMRSPFLLVTINGEIALTPEVELFFRRCAAALRRGGAALAVQLYGISKAQQESSSAYQSLKQIAEDSKIPIFAGVIELNQSSRGAGRTSPRRDGSAVAIPPLIHTTHNLLMHAQRP